jgi:hypothetical protein
VVPIALLGGAVSAVVGGGVGFGFVLVDLGLYRVTGRLLPPDADAGG